MGGTNSQCINCTSQSCQACNFRTGVCTSCNAGYNWNNLTIISNNSCTTCSLGTYSLGGNMICTTCLSLACAACNPLNGFCTSCNAGYGWNSNGAATNNACTLCAIDFYSLGVDSACLPCTVINVNGCRSCNRVNNVCTSCHPGYHWNPSSNSCIACVAGTYSLGGNQL